MATSSIFASFNINDSKTAEAFVKALDESSKDPKWVPKFPEPTYITDKEKLREIFEKWEKKEND